MEIGQACGRMNQYLQNTAQFQEKQGFSLFEKYVCQKMEKAPLEALTTDIFRRFLLQELPKRVYPAMEEDVDKIFPVLYSFCEFCQIQYDTPLLERLLALPVREAEEFSRVLLAKIRILHYIQSPILNRDPLIVDIQSYRQKKQRQKNNAFYEQIIEEGDFVVSDFFPRNSVVLKKVSGYNFFIRLYLTPSILTTLRQNDVLRLRVKEKNYLSTWSIEEIHGCYLPGALDKAEAVL